MNAGLSSLIVLKRQLLNSTLVSGTTYDAAITAIGQGVAAQFEKICNRLFYRTVGEVDIFQADRTCWTLRRYPVESVTTIESCDDADDGWTTQTGMVRQLMNQSGVLWLESALGSETTLVRVTYTGGYWFSTDETEAETQPSGSTALAGDLRMAFFLQCQEVWNKRDKLGLSLSKDPDVAAKLAELKLVPAVLEILKQHIRFTP